jgi:hypothetical protein
MRRTTPATVTGLAGVTAISAGDSHSVALRNNGTVWVWGGNFRAQLGNGSSTGSATPNPIPLTGLNGVTAITAGYWHSLALWNDGTVRAWGANFSGQLGILSTNQVMTPWPVWALNGVVAISAGEAHSLALRNDGTVRGWGSNCSGQIGNATVTFVTGPISVFDNPPSEIIDGRIYNIRNVAADRVLTAIGTTYVASNVRSRPLTGEDNQKWKARRHANGTFSFIPMHTYMPGQTSGMALEIWSGQVSIFPYSNNNFQVEHRLALAISSGAYIISESVSSNPRFISVEQNHATNDRVFATNTSAVDSRMRWVFEEVPMEIVLAVEAGAFYDIPIAVHNILSTIPKRFRVTYNPQILVVDHLPFGVNNPTQGVITFERIGGPSTEIVNTIRFRAVGNTGTAAVITVERISN